MIKILHSIASTIKKTPEGIWTYEEPPKSDSSAAQVFPIVVITTPAMLTKTASTFATFRESWPKIAPTKRVKSPDVEDNTVVLATLVRASAAFEKYCNHKAISIYI